MKPKINPPIAALGILCACIMPTQAATIIVSETFGGLSTDNLNGTSADTFAAGITSAGGSSTWVTKDTDYRANGQVVGTGSGTSTGGSAHLNLGSYVNDAKGTASGKFVLTATVSTTSTGTSWLSLGFATQNSPTVTDNFTDAFPGSTTGVASMIVRQNGDIDQWAGTSTTNEVAADNTIIGTSNRTLTITLDFTPDYYNGTTTFGRVIFDVAGASSPYPTTAFDFTSNNVIGSMLLSWAGSNTNATGSYANLTLTQIPEPRAALLGSLGLFALLRRRRSA